MSSRSLKIWTTIVRIAIALMVLLPAVGFHCLLSVAQPDLKTWLSVQTEGYSRPDAFDGVNRVSETFSVLFDVFSILTALLIIFRRYQQVLLMIIGPVLTTLCYLAGNGFHDPAWMSLLALLSIGMLVSSVVVVALIVCQHRPRARTEPSPKPVE